MQRTLIVHIGLPKAGSTSIQQTLRAQQPRILHQGVWALATSRRQPFYNHNQLVRTLSGEGRVHTASPRLWYALAKELRDCPVPTPVLTAELFTAEGMLTHTPAHIAVRYLSALIERCGVEVRLVAYVRPQYQLLESLYAQAARKSRCTDSFEGFVADALSCRLFDFNRIFAPWRRRFGNRLEVWPLVPETMPEGPAAHFLGLLGVTGGARQAESRANERIGAKALEVKRLLGAGLAAGGIPFERRARVLESLVRLPELLAPDAPFAPLNASEAMALTKRFEASNALFANVYGLDDRRLSRAPTDGRQRPNRAAWTDLRPGERSRVRDYVQAETGVDLEVCAGARRGGPRIRWVSRARRRAARARSSAGSACVRGVLHLVRASRNGLRKPGPRASGDPLG